MEMYLVTYNKHLESTYALQKQIMNSVVIAIKTISVKPLEIGNMMYFYTKVGEIDVPAYCYKTDYDQAIFEGKTPMFMPIFDEENTGYFGWSDFGECCNIFDVIRAKLLNDDTKGESKGR